IVWSLHDGFARDVERRVEHHRNASTRFELPQQLVEEGILIVPKRLHAPRAIDMNDGRYGSRLLSAKSAHAQHVRTLEARLDVEPRGDILLQHHRREGSERFASLDRRVDSLLHRGEAGISHDAALAECAGTQLRAALKPPDDLPFGQELRRLLSGMR